MPFDYFVDSILDSEPMEDDQHWRRQRANVLADCIDLDFVGYLERFEADFERVRRAVPLATIDRFAPHATNASEKLEAFIGPSTKDKILRKYREDFETFGYSDDLHIVDPIHPISKLRCASPAGLTYLEAMVSPDLPRRKELLTSAFDLQPNPVTGVELVIAKQARGERIDDTLQLIGEQWSDFPGLLHFKAQYLEGTGHFAEALSTYERLVARVPYEFGFLAECAALLVKQGHLADASAMARKALVLRPWSEEMSRLATTG